MPNAYLTKFAEPETSVCAKAFSTAFGKPSTASYGQVLCIPAYDEAPDFFNHLPEMTSGNKKKWLLILVINQPESQYHCHTNDKLQSWINRRFSRHPRWQCERARLFTDDRHDVLLIDRYCAGHRIPDKQGVGLARKIASDLACWLIHNQYIESPWIYTSDADINFPAGYFSATDNLDSNKHSAGIYPFVHVPVDKHKTVSSLPMELYEFGLNYYCAGLTWAKSPYAFHTIGSCLAVHYKHYAKVRGFPKRAAGEDFYLLNKLNKTGKVISLTTPILAISSRISHRVPFGTGPGVAAIESLEHPTRDYRVYHPAVFHQLRAWLLLQKMFWQFSTDFTSEQFYATAGNLLAKNKDPNLCINTLLATLKAFNIFNVHRQARANCRNEVVYLKYWHDWFDAFRTLKFIHHLRQHHLSSCSLTELQNPIYFSSALLSAEQIGRMEDSQEGEDIKRDTTQLLHAERKARTLQRYILANATKS